MGEILTAKSEPIKAEYYLKKAEKLAINFLNKYPDNFKLRSVLLETYISLGWLLEKENRIQESIVYYNSSKQILQELIVNFPDYHGLHKNLKIVKDDLKRISKNNKKSNE